MATQFVENQEIQMKTPQPHTEVLCNPGLLKETCWSTSGPLTTTPFLILTLEHNSQIFSSLSVPQSNHYGCGSCPESLLYS